MDHGQLSSRNGQSAKIVIIITINVAFNFIVGPIQTLASLSSYFSWFPAVTTCVQSYSVSRLISELRSFVVQKSQRNAALKSLAYVGERQNYSCLSMSAASAQV